MSYKVSVDGVVIGTVEDLPGMTLIASALTLAGDEVDDGHGAASEKFLQPNVGFTTASPLGRHGPARVTINGTTIEIETCSED